MTETQLQPYLFRENEPAHKAYFYMHKFTLHRIIIVVDNDGRAVGTLAPNDFDGQDKLYKISYKSLDGKSVGDICNRRFIYINASEDKWLRGRSIFAERENVDSFPVLDENGRPVEIFSRWQAFFRDFIRSEKHPRTFYGECIQSAAERAILEGINEISVLEFGVATGTGLYSAEKFAEVVEHDTGVKIQVFGFDTGMGIPEFSRNDQNTHWKEHDFQMDYDDLLKHLSRAKLLLGDIRATASSFLITPPPIGAIFIDVDIYSAAVAALDLLLNDDKYFLSKVYMWFDDLEKDNDFGGEQRAIREFNAKSESVKITPEYGNMQRWREKFRTCERLEHPFYKRVRKPINAENWVLLI